MGWDFSKNPMYAENAQPGQVFSSVPGVSAPDGNKYYTGDFRYEPLSDWSRLTLPQTLWEQGDSRGAFGDVYTNWKAEQDAAKHNFMDMGYGSIPGWEFKPAAGSFTGYSREQLDAYLQPNDFVKQTNLPYLQQIVTSSDGNDYVSNAAYKDDSGFLDKMSNIVGGALPLIGLAAPALGASIGAGALGAGGALTADALAAEIAGLTGSGVATGGAIGTGAVAGGLGSLGEILNSIPNPFSGGTGASGSGAVTGDALAAEIAGLTGSGVATGGALGTGATAGSSGAGSLGSAASSALGRILGGTATAADWGQILGTVGSTALGVYGSNQQSDALTQIANQSRADRQPFLNKSLEWLNNPSSYMEGIGKPALDATLRALSVQGNPLGNPTSLALAGDIANKNWQNAVTGFGNIGLAGQDSRNSLLANAAQSQSGMYDALGYGLNQLTQPKQSLSDLARAFGITGLA